MDLPVSGSRCHADAKRRHDAVPDTRKEADAFRSLPTHAADLRLNGRDKTWQGDKGTRPEGSPDSGERPPARTRCCGTSSSGGGSASPDKAVTVRPCRCRAEPVSPPTRPAARGPASRAAGTWRRARPGTLAWPSGAGSAMHAAAPRPPNAMIQGSWACLPTAAALE
jgi:hypothetical protein